MNLRSPVAREVLATLAIGAFCVLFCHLLAVVHPHFFWHDDFQLAGVPSFYDMRRSWEGGEWPFLSPATWNAGSYLGEYQPGLFSPLTQGAMLLAAYTVGPMAAVGVTYASVLLAVTAMGAFRIARDEALAAPYAAMVALVAAFNGWSMCWAACNWVSAMAGFAATTLAWWGLATVARPGPTARRLFFATIGIYFLMTAGWPHTIFMAAVITAWILLREARERQTSWPVVPVVAAWLLGIGLSAMAWLPFVEYISSTKRATVGLALQFIWLVPATGLPGLVLPSWITYWDNFNPTIPHISQELANGLVPTAAALALIFGLGRKMPRAAGYALLLAVVGLTLSMAPSVGMFRWSFRWLPLFHIGFALAAAHALAAIHAQERSAARGHYAWLSNAGVWALLAVGATYLASQGQPQIAPYLPVLLFGVALVWTGIEERLAGTNPVRQWFPAAGTALVLFATLTMLPNGIAFPAWKLVEGIRQPAPLDPTLRYLGVAGARDYVQTGIESDVWGVTMRPGSTMFASGLKFVNGYSALAPSGLAAAFEIETHGFINQERIPALATVSTRPGGLLDRMGVDGFVLGGWEKRYLPAVQANGWELIAEAPEAVVLHRKGARAPVPEAVTAIRFVPLGLVKPWQAEIDQADGVTRIPARAGVPVGETIALTPRQVTLVAERRNATTIDVAPGPGPAMVRLDRPWIPGWRARQADGVPVGLVALDGCQLGVELPPGVGGRIEVYYFPKSLERGLWVAAATTIPVVGLLVWRPRRRPDEV